MILPETLKLLARDSACRHYFHRGTPCLQTDPVTGPALSG